MVSDEREGIPWEKALCASRRIEFYGFRLIYAPVSGSSRPSTENQPIHDFSRDDWIGIFYNSCWWRICGGLGQHCGDIIDWIVIRDNFVYLCYGIGRFTGGKGQKWGRIKYLWENGIDAKKGAKVFDKAKERVCNLINLPISLFCIYPRCWTVFC